MPGSVPKRGYLLPFADANTTPDEVKSTLQKVSRRGCDGRLNARTTRTGTGTGTISGAGTGTGQFLGTASMMPTTSVSNSPGARGENEELDEPVIETSRVSFLQKLQKFKRIDEASGHEGDSQTPRRASSKRHLSFRRKSSANPSTSTPASSAPPSASVSVSDATSDAVSGTSPRDLSTRKGARGRSKSLKGTLLRKVKLRKLSLPDLELEFDLPRPDPAGDSPSTPDEAAMAGPCVDDDAAGGCTAGGCSGPCRDESSGGCARQHGAVCSRGQDNVGVVGRSGGRVGRDVREERGEAGGGIVGNERSGLGEGHRGEGGDVGNCVRDEIGGDKRGDMPEEYVPPVDHGFGHGRPMGGISGDDFVTNEAPVAQVRNDAGSDDDTPADPFESVRSFAALAQKYAAEAEKAALRCSWTYEQPLDAVSPSPSPSPSTSPAVVAPRLPDFTPLSGGSGDVDAVRGLGDTAATATAAATTTTAADSTTATSTTTATTTAPAATTTTATAAATAATAAYVGDSGVGGGSGCDAGNTSRGVGSAGAVINSDTRAGAPEDGATLRSAGSPEVGVSGGATLRGANEGTSCSGRAAQTPSRATLLLEMRPLDRSLGLQFNTHRLTRVGKHMRYRHIVNWVKPGGPAQLAGFEPGVEILRVGAESVVSCNSDELVMKLQSVRGKCPVEVRVPPKFVVGCQADPPSLPIGVPGGINAGHEDDDDDDDDDYDVRNGIGRNGTRVEAQVAADPEYVRYAHRSGGEVNDTSGERGRGRGSGSGNGGSLGVCSGTVKDLRSTHCGVCLQKDSECTCAKKAEGATSGAYRARRSSVSLLDGSGEGLEDYSRQRLIIEVPRPVSAFDVGLEFETFLSPEGDLPYTHRVSAVWGDHLIGKILVRDNLLSIGEETLDLLGRDEVHGLLSAATMDPDASHISYVVHRQSTLLNCASNDPVAGGADI
eukprot:Rmarinus@m.23074